MSGKKLITDIPNFLKKTILCAVILFAGMGAAWSETYYWVGGTSGDFVTSNWKTNPDGTGSSPENFTYTANDFYVTNDTPVTITITDNTSLARLDVCINSSQITLVLNANLTIGGNFNIISPDGTATHDATLILSGTGTLTANVIDTPQNFDGYHLGISIGSGVTLNAGQIWADAVDQTTSPSFQISGEGTASIGSGGGSIDIDDTITVQNTSGNWTYTITPQLSEGTTSTVTIKNSANNFSTIYAAATRTGSGTETYKLNTTEDLLSTTQIDFETAAQTQTFTITLPDEIASGNGFSLTLYSDAGPSNQIGTSAITFTSTGTTSIWNGTAWDNDNDPGNNTKKIIINGDYTVPSATFFSSLPKLTRITINSGKKLSTGTNAVNFNNCYIYNNGNIEVNGSETGINTSKVTQATGTTISFTGPGASSLFGNTYENLTISSDATLALSSDITINGTCENNGTISGSSGIYMNGTTISGNGNYGSNTVNLGGMGKTYEITGSNTFGILSISGMGTTVKFGAGKTQTVGTFKSNRTSGNDVLLTTNASSPSVSNQDTWWNIITTPDADYILNTKIEYSKLTSTSIPDWDATFTENVEASTENWFIREYFWYGKADTSWDTASNWSTKADPYTAATSAPLKNNSHTKITITDSSSNVLKLTDNITAESITIDEGQTLDIAGKTVTAAITNNGTLKLEGVSSQISGTMTNGTSSTVEYTGTNAVLIWDEYVNLVISGTGSCSDSTTELKVSRLTTFNTTGNISLTNSNNVFTGGVTITKAGAVELDSTSGFTLNSSTECTSLKNDCPVTISGTSNTITTFIANNNIILAEDATITGALSVPADVEIEGSHKLTVTDTTTLNGNITTTESELSLGNVSAISTPLVITAPSITVGAVNTDYIDNTKDLTLATSNCTFSSFGDTSNKFAKITLGLSSEALTISGTDYSDIHSTELVLLGSSISTSNITYADTLTYNTTGTISITGVKAGIFNIPSNAASVSFGGSITQTSSTADFVIDYPAKLSASTTFDITKEFILDDTTTPSSIGSITPDIAESYTLTISAANILVNHKIGETKLSALTFNGNVKVSDDFTFNASTVQFAATGKSLSSDPTGKTVTISGDFVNVSGISTTLNSDVIISGNFTNEGTINANADVNLAGNFTDRGTWAAANGTKITLDGTSTDGRTFVPGTSTYDTIILDNNAENLTVSGSNSLQTKTFTITSGKETSFEKSVIITTDFTITSATTTSFNEAVTIPTFTDATAAGTINFNAGGTITSIGNSDELLTTSPVNFGDGTGTDSLTITNGIKHTAGSTSIKGTLATTNADVEFDEITSSNGTLDAGTGTATFNNNITLTATSSITASTTTFAGTTTLSGGILTITGNAEVSSSKSLEIATGAELSISKNYTNYGTTTANGPVNVAGYFEDSTGTWSGSATLTFDGTTAQNATLNTGTTYPSIKKSNTNKLTFTGNVLIASFTDETTSGETVFVGSSTFESDTTFNSDVTISDTMVIYGNFINKGIFTANADVKLTGNFTDRGTWTAANGTKITLDGTSPDGRTFVPGTSTYDTIILDNNAENLTVSGSNSLQTKTFTITSGKETSFEKSVIITTDFTITSATTTSFNEAVTITTFTDATAAGTINFNAGGTITSIGNSDELLTTSPVNFGDGTGTDSLTITNGIKHTAGSTSIIGTLTTSNADVTLGTIPVLNGTINAGTGNATFHNNITLAAASSITAATTTFAGTTTLSGGKLSITGNAEVATSKALEIATGAELAVLGNYANYGTTTANATSKVQVAGNFEDSTGNWSGSGDLIFNGNSTQTITPNSATEYASVINQNNSNTVTISQFKATKFEANATNAKTIFSAATEIGTLKITAAASTTFNATATITSYSDETAAGTVTFNTNSTFGSDTTFNTTGSVTFGSTSANIIDFTDGTSRKTLTHTAGPTVINGTLRAATINLGDNTGNITTTLQGTINSTSTITIGPLLITGISGHLIGPTSIQIGATTTDASPATPPSMNLFLETPVLKSSSIGTIDHKFNEIMIGKDDEDLSFDSTSDGNNNSDINTVRLIFRGNLISLTGLEIDDELSFSTSKTITLNNIKAKAINFPTTEYSGVILKNKIETTSTASGLSFQKPVTLYANTELKSKDVTFGTGATINSDGDTPRNLKITTNDGDITFGAVIGGNKPLGAITLTKSPATAETNLGANITATSLTDDGNVNFTATDINLTANVIYSGDTKEITGNNYTITGNLTNSGNILYQVDQTITGNLTDTGTWTSTNAIILSGNGAQTVTPVETTQYNLIQIQKSAGSVTFEKSVLISTFTDSSTSTALNFKAGGTITNDLTHTTGPTSIKGTLTGAEINLAALTLNGNSTINATNDISFSGSISDGSTDGSSYTLKLKNVATTSKINLKDVTVKTLTFDTTATACADKINLNSTIKTTTPLTFPFDVTLAGNSTILAPDTNTIFPTNIIVTLGAFNFDINSYTLFNSTLNGSGTLTVGTSDNENSDLIICDDAANSININAPVVAKQNLVVFSGNLTATADISVEKDLIFFGSAYNTTDQQTALVNQYNYYEGNFLTTTNGSFKHGGKLPSVSSSNNNFPATPAYSAVLTTSAAVTIKVDQNFYANGLTATGSTDWNLKLRSNKNTNANYARAYYCDFTASSCNVSCFESGAAADAVCIAAEQCTVKNQGTDSNPYEVGWDLSDFEIIDAYTVHDNIICIKFNRPVRNLSGVWNAPDTDDILNTANTPQIHFSADGDANTGDFENFYKNFDYNQANPFDEANKTELFAGDAVDTIYIRTGDDLDGTNYTWNTDATGISSGRETSTNTSGVHKTAVPYLNIKRNSGDSFAAGEPNDVSTGSYRYFLTDLYGKRLNHYYSDTVPETENSDKGSTFTAVHDCCSPVMVTVKTGQELHEIYDKTVGEASQHSYDSHNFIEFSYSEAVNLGSQTATECDIWIPALDAAGEPTVTENVKVTNMFGALSGDITTQGTLNFTGLGTIADGKIHTGIAGTTDATMNALYRSNEYSFRLSIAGYTNGTIADKDGHNYKNWEGYIENAVLPSGTYELSSILNPLVTDIAGNQQKSAGVQINVDSTINDTYGPWDISEPVFALCRLSITAPWGERRFAEAVGTGSGSTLDKIEFHFFDNTPLYTQADLAAWFTQKGWCINDDTLPQPELYDPDYTYCADIIGGSRYFNTDDETVTADNRTTGGIRFSTTAVIPSAFKYSKTGSKTPDSPFTENISGVYPTVTSPIFTGSSSPRRSADDPDGLYFGLGLPETNLPVETTFTVSYDESAGYLTDLAGNRLRSDVISTIDRTPPSIDMSLSPINQDELFVIFVKELVTDSSKLMYLDSNGNNIQIAESFEEIMPYCFDIISIGSDGTPNLADIQVDRTTPAKVQVYTNGTDDDLLSKSTFTFITLKLTRNLTLKDIQTLHLRITYPEQYTEISTDPVTSIKDARVTLLQDIIGNYTPMYTAHALSEFLIGGITPMYAYDADMTYGEETIMNGLYEEGSWAVHDWEVDQQNYGTLPQNHPIAVGVQLDDGTTEQENLPSNVRIFLSNAPDSDSIASQFNSDFARELRVWLPSVTDGLFPGFALANNTNFAQADSRYITNSLKDGLIFDISKDITSQWANGDQISFLFGLLNNDGTPFRIFNSPYYNVGTGLYEFDRSSSVPLYSMRLHDPSDILSLDLWSFKVRSITEQRGGVTILNNVINSVKGEKTVVKVNMPTDGKLNVIVMTLDGNVVQYLAHGQTTAGEHYYSWNGKNKNGAPVARGMYFIRVVGSGFDETRKVMVVK